MTHSSYGLPLIPQPYARTVGEEARLRANKAQPPIEAAEKKLGKASGDAASQAASNLQALRARVVVELSLPSRRVCAEGMAPLEVKQEAKREIKYQVEAHDSSIQPPAELLAADCLRDCQQAKWAPPTPS